MPGATRCSVPCSRRQIARPGGDACSAPQGEVKHQRQENQALSFRTGPMIRIVTFLVAMLPALAAADSVRCTKGWVTFLAGNGVVYAVPHSNISWMGKGKNQNLGSVAIGKAWSGPHPSKGSRINIQRHRRLPSRPRVMIGERRSRPRRDQMGRASDGHFSLILRRPSRRAGFSTTPLARRARSSSAGGSEKT